VKRLRLDRRGLLRGGLAFGVLAGCGGGDAGFGSGGTGSEAPDTTGGGADDGGSDTSVADTADTGGATDDDRYFLSYDDCPELEEDGGYCTISNGGLSIVVINEGGDVYAVLAVCTHQACSTSFDGSQHTCPCHGSTFEPDGSVTNGPATTDLAEVDVEVTADGVYVDVDSIS